MFYSKIITWIFCIFLLSIWWGEWLSLELILVSLPLIFLGVFFISGWSRSGKLIVFLVVLVLVGQWRYHSFIQKHSWVTLSEQHLQGVISSQVEVKDRWQEFKVRLDNYSRQIIVKTQVPLPLEYGLKVAFSCRLSRPQKFSDFNYEYYLLKEKSMASCQVFNLKILEYGQGNFIYQRILKLKKHFIGQLQSYLPEPQSSFLSGLLVGGSSGLPQKIVDEFRRTGTSHIIAVSGFNVAIIINFISSLSYLLKISRKTSFLFISVLLIFYNLITGFQASIVRAVVMGWVLVLAKVVRRKVNFRNLILGTAVVLVLINPLILRYDLGFQLSFLATLGLVFFSPLLLEWLPGGNSFIGKDLVIPSLAAYIFTLPILIFNFQKLALVAPLVNILIAPLIPLAMLLGFSMVILFLQPLVGILMIITWGTLSLILKIISYFANWQFTQISVPEINSFWIIISYLVLWGLVKFFYPKKISVV